jgi:hypothetical protein
MTVRNASAQSSDVHDDRVLPATRAVAWAIVPFLVVAFAVLYPWPGDTRRLFAWGIGPPMSAMVLGSAYLGGAYFFARAATAGAWHTVKAGFPPVAVFATLMGVATVLHWGLFSHGHVAFWLWAFLYFTTPFLVAGVWLANRGRDDPAAGADPLIPRAAAWALCVAGVLALVTGVVLFAAAAAAPGWWPWRLSPLTAQVLGAIFCLGIAGIGAPADRRWSSARIPAEVAGVMLALMLLAGIRAHGEFDPANPLTWILAAGFGGAAAAVAILYWRMHQPRP